MYFADSLVAPGLGKTKKEEGKKLWPLNLWEQLDTYL